MVAVQVSYFGGDILKEFSWFLVDSWVELIRFCIWFLGVVDYPTFSNCNLLQGGFNAQVARILLGIEGDDEQRIQAVMDILVT